MIQILERKRTLRLTKICIIIVLKRITMMTKRTKRMKKNIIEWLVKIRYNFLGKYSKKDSKYDDDDENSIS